MTDERNPNQVNGIWNLSFPVQVLTVACIFMSVILVSSMIVTSKSCLDIKIGDFELDASFGFCSSNVAQSDEVSVEDSIG